LWEVEMRLHCDYGLIGLLSLMVDIDLLVFEALKEEVVSYVFLWVVIAVIVAIVGFGRNQCQVILLFVLSRVLSVMCISTIIIITLFIDKLTRRPLPDSYKWLILRIPGSFLYLSDQVPNKINNSFFTRLSSP
jgi:hypothetical protein